MTSLNNLQNQSFRVRLAESDTWTRQLVQHLQKLGHITSYRKSTEEEDKKELIDYWFDYPDGQTNVPIAFKLRIRPGRRDIPVVLYQPFSGVDAETVKSGRDYRCLVQDKVKQYYVGVKNQDGQFCEIYRISKANLFPRIEKLFTSWKEEEYDGSVLVPHDKMTMLRHFDYISKGKRRVQLWRCGSDEIWWQSNTEIKINSYVSEKAKEESFLIETADYSQMLQNIS